MGAELQQMLRSLCSNTGWHYAICWRLRWRHSQMMLTWEDAYFGSCGENDFLSKHMYNSQDYLPNARYLHDSVKLALTPMSYDVYPLGEGIIGEVAASGKHQWVFGDKHAATSSSFVQEHNGWRTQFSVGIKTVAIIDVAPKGVVQLGSLYKIKENMKLVYLIKQSLLALQMSSVHRNVGGDAVESNEGALDLPVDDDCAMLLHQDSDSEQLGQIYSKLMDGIPPQLKMHMDSEACGISPTCNMDSVHALRNLAFRFDDSGSSFPFHDSNCESHDRVNLYLLDQCQDLLPSSHMKDPTQIKLDMQASLSQSESPTASLKFSTGCELHEALGPAFSKQLSYNDRRMEAAEVKTGVDYSEGISSTSSQLAPSSGSEHLLEAVVANIFNNVEDYKSDRTCKSMQSRLTTDYTPEASYGDHRNLSTDPSSSYPSSAKEDISHCLRTSEAYFARSPTILSSTCVSSCAQLVSKSPETSKGNKKRARPGESLKPRPRDRQLIQDRIKELRELIPSGAKCSIDSLLERTIKHMQFMRNMSEHADKLKQCAESKMQTKNAVEGSSCSHELGSSWAVEVGGQLTVCRILVENVNMNRQMLIEMLCDECSHFLEIVEVIKSLGLTILKGATEACGEKTWICFLVEGQKKKSMQRLDILWSLMHVLQPKNTARVHRDTEYP